MSPSEQFAIRYTAEALEHLRGLQKKYRRAVLDKIVEQLAHEPLTQTRNRKSVPGSTLFGPETWELRFGPANRFRVFYRPDAAERAVLVKGIGVKQGSRLTIGGQEVTP